MQAVTHVILICFGRICRVWVLCNDVRFSIDPQWQGETQEFCPNAKVVLVGCKLDMRTDLNVLRELSKLRLIPVTHEQVRRDTLKENTAQFSVFAVIIRDYFFSPAREGEHYQVSDADSHYKSLHYSVCSCTITNM